jgi:multidrug efflux pump subunit AcrA (membrane-fusion protein)
MISEARTTVRPMASAEVAPDSAVTKARDVAEAPATWVDDFDFDRSFGGEQPKPRFRRIRWLAIPVIVVIIAGAAIWIANPFGTTPVSLVTATATTGTVVSSVSISGSVASSTIKELNFAAAGTVTALNVAVGDKVTAGQVLATIDDAALNVQLETAQANLDAAQARLTLDEAGPTAATIASARDSVNQAKLQLSTARQSLGDTKAQNAQSLAQANADLKTAKTTLAADQTTLPPGDPQLTKDKAAVTQAANALSAAKLKATLALHQAQNQVNSASLGLTSAEHNYILKIAPATAAQIASDKAAVASAQLSLSTLKQTGSSITSPIDGTVTVVSLVVGEQVSAPGGSNSSSSSTATGQIEVMDLAKLQVAGQASETDVPKLKLGQAATITASGLGSETVVGKVCALSIVGTQISGVTSFGVTVCVDGANPALLVGMSATAAVVTSRADNAVLVPSLAVKTVGAQQVVTVLGADGKTQTNVPVTVGITNGSQTQIVSGLREGQTVVETLQSTTTNRNGGGPGGRFFQGGGFVGG